MKKSNIIFCFFKSQVYKKETARTPYPLNLRQTMKAHTNHSAERKNQSDQYLSAYLNSFWGYSIASKVLLPLAFGLCLLLIFKLLSSDFNNNSSTVDQSMFTNDLDLMERMERQKLSCESLKKNLAIAKRDQAKYFHITGIPEKIRREWIECEKSLEGIKNNYFNIDQSQVYLNKANVFVSFLLLFLIIYISLLGIQSYKIFMLRRRAKNTKEAIRIETELNLYAELQWLNAENKLLQEKKRMEMEREIRL